MPSTTYGTGMRGLALATLITITAALALVFFYAPLDATQGFVQKIFYVHVPLAIVSLGERRVLRMRPRGGGPSRPFVMHGGDLFVMGGDSQRTWEHSVPKTAQSGPRLSVQFRHDV